MSTTNMTQDEVEKLAKAAGCDPRTFTKYLAGLPVYSLSKQRIEKALREAGKEQLVRRTA